MTRGAMVPLTTLGDMLSMVGYPAETREAAPPRHMGLFLRSTGLCFFGSDWPPALSLLGASGSLPRTVVSWWRVEHD
eukprot:2190205-Karenia_brevis.AAC.1